MEATKAFYIENRIRQAPLRSDPFPNFYIENVFPDDIYAQILENLPPREVYVIPPRVQNATAERLICDADKLGIAFWDDLTKWFLDTDFAAMLIDKFSDAFKARFGDVKLKFGNDTRLVKDFENYQIKVHTDTPVKVISLLFYLPRDEEDISLGTSFYVPRDPGFRCTGTRRHQFSLFNKVWTAPFKPNSVLGFFKTDYSFHGVEPIHLKTERNVFLYNLYATPE